MSTIASIHTACKKCVFAEYNNNSQVGCSIGHLEKYRNINATILEAYDEEKEFYIINEKKCLCYRENSWFTKYDMEHSTLQEKIAKVKETNYLHYLLVINLYDFNADDLTKITNEIKSLPIKPQKIIFVRYSNNKTFEFNVLNDVLKQSNLKCSWRIQSMIDNSLNYDQILHNIVSMNKGYRFIVSIKNPTSDIHKIISFANNKVYEALEALHVVANNDKSCILFSAPSYRFSLLIEGKNILDNIEYVI